MNGLTMPGRTTRSAFVIVVCAAVGVVTAAPAHAFTPPLGSDKGSITAGPAPSADGSTHFLVVKDHDLSSPY